MVSVLSAAACLYFAYGRLRKRLPLTGMGKRAKGGQGAEAESDVVMSMWNPLSPSAGKPAASPARSPKKERSGGGGPLSASSAQAEPEGGSSGQGVGGFQVSNPLIKSRVGLGAAPSVVSAAE